MKIVIVGTGIGGLVAARLLQNENHEVVIYEKNNRPGGRMKTAYLPNENGLAQTHETGAWRVKGSLAEELIMELGGTLVPIEDRPFQEECIPDDVLQNIARMTHNFHSSMKNLSAYDVATIAGISESHIDKGYHGISDRKINTRSYSTGVSSEKSHYFYCAEGWSWVIDQLSLGLNIQFGTKFTGFDGKHAAFINRSGGDFRIKTDACLLAIPPSAFPKNDLMLDLLSETVQSHALVHVWFRTNKQVSSVDFRANEKSAISQIVANPFQPSDVCQVYACDRHAFTWLRLHQESKKKCIKFLNSELENYGFDFRATEIIDLNFWENAVHTWRPVSSFDKNIHSVSKQSIQPDPIHRPTLFTCGEAFSEHQGWCDGAIETAYLAVEKILQKKEKMKPVKTGMRFNGYTVALQEQWLVNHPGGAQALMNHSAEDITKLWNVLHATSQSKATLWHMLKLA